MIANGIPDGALAGIRVLDLTHVLAGPYCTMILADLGADVVKVESPEGGDLTRTIRDEKDFSAYFGSVNRNKRSLVLNLKRPEGIELMNRLAGEADVFVQNLGPGVAERLGLGHVQMMEKYPRLIYAMVTGFGADGPWSQRKGVDPAVQALSGAMSLTGEPNGQPMRVGFSIADLSGGIWLAMGVLAALVERGRSGRGQLIDVSLLEAQMSLLENAMVRYLDTGVVPKRMGGAHALETLTRSYETSDGAMVVGLSARNWDSVCALWGREEWKGEAVKPFDEYMEHLLPRIQALFKTKSSQYWIEQLGALGVQCTPILSIKEAVELPPIQERGFIQHTVDGNGRRLRVAGSPMRLSRTPARVRHAAPLLGEHSQETLQDWLGMESSEFQKNEDSGLFRHERREIRGFW